MSSVMNPPEEQQYLELFSEVAVRLMESSAETRLVVQTTERIARAFGYPDIQVIVLSGMVCISVKTSGGYQSLTRKGMLHGIQMDVLAEITGLCLEAEQARVSFTDFQNRFRSIRTREINPLLLCFVIGLATAAFGWLNDGSFLAGISGFLAGFITMAFRVLLQKYVLFPVFVFGFLGFFGTLISYSLGVYIFRLPPDDLGIALVIGVLLLVPGFPFVNGVLDLFKGYYSMAFNRLMITTILLTSVSLGITAALHFLPLGFWSYK
ncbi:threonine/serine exporter family protein [Succinimonas amylolytica]|uniref:threonine/serine exporter family protein n=1 Tax=Succinimonas amylolytica TaxID=83769 RepID=UPI000364E889|nr:threonine/serine exporter family protein [Succinimonas amylolytica]